MKVGRIDLHALSPRPTRTWQGSLGGALTVLLHEHETGWCEATVFVHGVEPLGVAQVAVLSGSDLDDLAAEVAELLSDLAVVPLEDEPCDHCMPGIAVVASDHPMGGALCPTCLAGHVRDARREQLEGRTSSGGRAA